MASDFAVVFNTRLHFGSNPGHFNDETIYPLRQLVSGATFVGAEKTIFFDSPGIDLHQPVVLMYQSYGVNLTRNVIRMNGTKIPEGIAVSSRRDEWKNNLSILEPGVMMQDNANELFIEARGETDDQDTNRDNFLLASAVVLYKIKT